MRASVPGSNAPAQARLQHHGVPFLFLSDNFTSSRAPSPSQDKDRNTPHEQIQQTNTFVYTAHISNRFFQMMCKLDGFRRPSNIGTWPNLALLLHRFHTEGLGSLAALSHFFGRQPGHLRNASTIDVENRLQAGGGGSGPGFRAPSEAQMFLSFGVHLGVFF